MTFLFSEKIVSAFCFVVSNAFDGAFAKYFVGLESSEPIHPFSSQCT
jgi:hypothetical protein